MTKNIFFQKTDKPYIQAYAVVLRGSNHDTVHGIAHLIEHVQCLMPSGKNTVQEFNEILEKEDITVVNAYTTPERVIYIMKGLPGTEKRLMYWLSKMIETEASEEVIAREKKVIIDEIDQAEKRIVGAFKNPRAQEIIIKSIFPEVQNFSQFVNLGSKETLASITKEDIHSFKNKYYHGATVAYIFQGSIDVTTLQEYSNDITELDHKEKITQDVQKINGEFSEKNSVALFGFRNKKSEIIDEYFASLYSFLFAKVIRGEMQLTYDISPFETTIGGNAFHGFSISAFDGRFDDYRKTVEVVKNIFAEDSKKYFTIDFFDFIKSRKKKAKVFNDFDINDFNHNVFLANITTGDTDMMWEEYEKKIMNISYEDCIHHMQEFMKNSSLIEVYIDKDDTKTLPSS